MEFSVELKRLFTILIVFSLVACVWQSPFVPVGRALNQPVFTTSEDYTQAERLSIVRNDELIAAGFPGSSGWRRRPTP